MTAIYNCDQSELIDRASEELKNIETVKPPAWSAVVKTGMHKERPPVRNDWWYTRSASVLSQVYRHGPIGVSKLRNKYGGKKNRGMKPGRFYKGSGNILRKIFQQLESAGFVKKEEKEVHKGRVITAEGKKFLDGVALKISKVQQVQLKVAKESEKKKVQKEIKQIPKEPIAEKKEIKKEEKTKPITKEESKTESKEIKQENKPISEDTKKTEKVEVKPEVAKNG